MKIESPEILEQERPLTLEEKAKLFPLSFWMRLGAKMKPQCFGVLHVNGGTCAIGAALDGIGALNRSTDRVFAQLFTYEGCKILDEIVKRNDYQRMTREQIADWLESIGY
jgi:hypothetical protein